MQPLYVHARPAAPQKHVEALDNAIALSEWSATTASADAANAVAAAGVGVGTYATNATNAAAYAANAATDAPNASTNAVSAAYTANAAADVADAKLRKPTTHAMRHDFELLVEATERFNWTDKTPVPSEFFGPLWPEGEPDGWPEEGKEPRLGSTEFELEVTGPPGVPAEEVVEQTWQLAVLLDRLSRVSGGYGIHIGDDVNDTKFAMAYVPVPQPVGCKC